MCFAVVRRWVVGGQTGRDHRFIVQRKGLCGEIENFERYLARIWGGLCVGVGDWDHWVGGEDVIDVVSDRRVEAGAARAARHDRDAFRSHSVLVDLLPEAVS